MLNHANISPLPAPPTVPSSTTVDSHQAAVLSWIREIAPYGILTTDADLRIRSWNEWLETHSGLAAPLVIGKPLLDPVSIGQKTLRSRIEVGNHGLG